MVTIICPKHLIKYPVLTEKTVRLIENNQYTFDVDLRLNKLQVKALIEKFFNVTVTNINTHIKPRKKKSLSSYKGYKSQYKRVIITVKSGETIPLLKNN